MRTNLAATMNPMPTMTQTLKRLARPKHPPRFRLTERDVAMLGACARFRFCSSVQIARLVGGSPQQVVRRLQYLFAHGYLDRPASQFVHLAGFVEGSAPLIYGLARKGAKLLLQEGALLSIDPEHLAQNNRSATQPYLAHTLAVAEFVIAAEAHCAAAGLQLLDQHALIDTMPSQTQMLRDPLRLQIECLGPDRKPTSIAVVPDRLFSIVQASARTNYALEIDRGTERIKNKFSLKHYAYHEAWRQDAFKAQWQFQRLRVVTVTTSEARIESMLAAQKNATRDSVPGLFCYTTFARLGAGLLAPIWRSAQGDYLTLLGGTDAHRIR